MDKVGFIGTGNMGGALVRAACKAYAPKKILIANRTEAKSFSMAEETGCCVSTPEEIAKTCDMIFLGVKPQGMEGLLSSLAPIFGERQDAFTLVSMAAGLEIATLQAMAGSDYPVIRMMPNTPVAVGEGVILYDCSQKVTGQTEEFFRELFRFGGLLDRLPEALIDAGSAIAGCGPAFASLFLEALADGAVACGLPRQKAIRYGAQMLAGTGKLALETGMHPGQIKDGVCSPGGSTIAGVEALEKGAFRGSTMEAVKNAYLRNKELGKK